MTIAEFIRESVLRPRLKVPRSTEMPQADHTALALLLARDPDAEVVALDDLPAAKPEHPLRDTY